MWYILYKERSDTKDIGTSKKKQSTRAWAVATSNTLREVWPPRQPCIIHTTFRSLIGLLLILPISSIIAISIGKKATTTGNKQWNVPTITSDKRATCHHPQATSKGGRGRHHKQ